MIRSTPSDALERCDAASHPAGGDPSRCPICGRPNDCQLCTSDAYKGPCWCAHAQIPEELIARIDPELRNKACCCRACVSAFHREAPLNGAQPQRAGDSYIDESGLLVFTAAYHLRRGYCCRSGCRHCPYQRQP